MAASIAFQSIVLRESDVPGAKLVCESIENIQIFSNKDGWNAEASQKQAIGVNSFKGKLFCFDTFHVNKRSCTPKNTTAKVRFRIKHRYNI